MSKFEECKNCLCNTCQDDYCKAESCAERCRNGAYPMTTEDDACPGMWEVEPNA